MTDSNGPETAESVDEDRRRVLGYAGLAALAASGAAGAWLVSRPPETGDEGTGEAATPTPDGAASSEETPAAAVPAAVERYAPDIYFGALEKWFPTDPRQYVVESDEGRVVDGFTALETYSQQFREVGGPPEPTVFYNVVEAADGVDAVQYWAYSVFDQFTVNFHWHDWELLQVFVERETGEPLLLSASAHARGTPNNEFVDPDIPDGTRPGILSEVGSHSSASEVNGVVPSFERVPTADFVSDVTNDGVDVSTSLRAPFAYGLPRDEGARLPFVLPELDGSPLHEHGSLSIERDDLLAESVTVDSWRGLPSPPDDIPLRESGLVFAHPDSGIAGEADATYALEPLDPLEDEIDAFGGPQLSFEFALPGFVEDQFASHITSVGIPWEQERFNDPLADVTDPGHRRRIDGAEPAGLGNRVVGRVRQLRAGTEGALDGVAETAQDVVGGVASVSLSAPSVELAVRLASENPTATVTRNGVFGYLHVESGEHQLAVNGPGLAPLAAGFEHDGGLVQAGSEGELTVVATEDAGWVRGDARETGGVSRVRIVEDYAGVVYDGEPVETDRFAVAVHREGHYTVEVFDSDGHSGAYRVTPDSFGDADETVRDGIRTGKLPLAETLRAELDELYALAETLAGEDGSDSTDGTDASTDGTNEVLDRLQRARRAAASAVAAAEDGAAALADEWLLTVDIVLEDIRDTLASESQGGYDDDAVAALDPRVAAGSDRANEALEAEL
ncbi:hypothetical protein [Halodesulfurarchaeum sp.]|uniref:hypothetical protein n=1 Tax=Halodesulfurarchaeum sp. TaxID=1980530 RepID=UPI002FC3C3DA